MEEAWRSVWQTENINPQNEQEFFKIYISTVNRLLQKDTLVASKLLSDVNIFLNKRSSSFLTRPNGILDDILKLHFVVFKTKREYYGQKRNLDIWSQYSILFGTIDSIFRKIEIQAMQEKGGFLFFDSLTKHIDNISVDTDDYKSRLFETFFHTFLKNIYDAPEKFDIWEHYFPGEWKVSKCNLLDSKNKIARMSCNNFFNWAVDRIQRPSKELDFCLNDVSTNLFPETDPILWAKILIFIFSPYGENRLQSVIERPWSFGFIGRMTVSFDSDHARKMYSDQVNSTLDLSYFLFKVQSSEVNLRDYLKSLNNLLYPEESENEGKRLGLIDLFTQMLHFVRNNQ